MDVQEGAGGRGEFGAAFVELGGFLGGVDGGDEEEVGDRGGKRFAFVYRGLACKKESVLSSGISEGMKNARS